MAVAATRECMLCVHMDFSLRKRQKCQNGGVSCKRRERGGPGLL